MLSITDSGSGTPRLQSEGTVLRDCLTLVSSLISFLLCLVLVLVYYRRIRLSFGGSHPSIVLSTLIWSLSFSIPANLFMAVSAALQWSGNLTQTICPFSLLSIDTFWIPEVVMETAFFFFVALESSGRRMEGRWNLYLVGFSTLISLVIVVSLTVALELLPLQPRYGTSMPWCWIPSNDAAIADGSQPYTSTTSSLIVMRLFSSYLWLLLADVVGVVSFIFFLHRLRRFIRQGILHGMDAAVKVRIGYFVYFVAGNTLMLLHRFGLVPDSIEGPLSDCQAFLEPSFAGFNAVIFMVSERSWLFWGPSWLHRGFNTELTAAGSSATGSTISPKSGKHFGTFPLSTGKSLQSELPVPGLGPETVLLASGGSVIRESMEAAVATSLLPRSYHSIYVTGGGVIGSGGDQPGASRVRFHHQFCTAPTVLVE